MQNLKQLYIRMIQITLIALEPTTLRPLSRTNNFDISHQTSKNLHRVWFSRNVYVWQNALRAYFEE